MSTFKNFTVQDFQQKQTPASTSRNAGQYFINDVELSHDSYKNTNDSYSDTSFESQRRLFRPQAPQVKPNNCKAQGGRPRTEIWDYFQSGRLDQQDIIGRGVTIVLENGQRENQLN